MDYTEKSTWAAKGRGADGVALAFAAFVLALEECARDVTEARLHGDLTMHGATRPITFDVKMTKADENDPEHAGHIHLAATTSVDRSDFNMNSFPVMLSNHVNLCIEFEAQLVRNEQGEDPSPALTGKSP